MRRPGGLHQSTVSKKPASRVKLKELQLRERSSKSLLANVLDIDDLILLRSNFNPTHFPPLSTLRPESTGRVQVANKTYQPDCVLGNGRGGRSMNCDVTASASEYSDCGAAEPDSSVSLLREILENVRQVTARLKKEDDRQDECSDWKFAAMVIDRLCLCLFTLFTVISTFAILFSSPHVLA